ncbi:lysostaphin resistance A-like protein [Oenococcus alcoholitolerans]|uniref:CPBP family intramembrane glutamic endopeptidase n=1 Tax=Oenococcus alcoholitolerans TaxID=931074 RepID=UPI003F71FE22
MLKIIPIFLWTVASLFISRIIIQISIPFFFNRPQGNFLSFSYHLRPMDIPTAFLINSFYEFVFLILLILGNALFFKIKINFSTLKIGSAIIYSLPILIFLSSNILLASRQLAIGNQSDQQIILAVVFAVLVGFAEEYAFRGMMLGNLLSSTNKNSFFYFAAIIIQGAAFGVLHSINLFHQSASLTITQMVYASAIGIIFGIVYTKTSVLIVPILIHALIDGSAFIAQPDSIIRVDMTVVPIRTTYAMIVILILIIIYAALTIFLANKKELNKLWK